MSCRELWAQIESGLRARFWRPAKPSSTKQVQGETSAAPGEIRSWLANYYPVWIEGEISGIGIVVVDITDRLAAEEFRSVVMDNMAEGLYALDSEGRLMFMNAAALKDARLERGRVARRARCTTRSTYQHADGSAFPAEECELLKAAVENRAVRVADDAFTRKDGSIFPVAYSSAPLITRSERPRRGGRLPRHDRGEGPTARACSASSTR